jgi:hypothetical protein
MEMLESKFVPSNTYAHHVHGSYGKFEDFAGRLAPASEVAGGHTILF